MSDPRDIPVSAEEAFRAQLDAQGVLIPGVLQPPHPSIAYVVFAQKNDVRLDAAALKHQASRFFSAKLGLTVEKRYGDVPPEVDVARVVLANDDGSASGTRLVFGRPAEPADLASAEAADIKQGSTGLALLAARCKTVWVVVPESVDDRVALGIAAIFASTLLGPILSPGGAELFGVRTARLKLEAPSRPYR